MIQREGREVLENRREWGMNVDNGRFCLGTEDGKGRKANDTAGRILLRAGRKKGQGKMYCRQETERWDVPKEKTENEKNAAGGGKRRGL